MIFPLVLVASWKKTERKKNTPYCFTVSTKTICQPPQSFSCQVSVVIRAATETIAAIDTQGTTHELHHAVQTCDH